jgi:hypothetical protein
MHVIKLAALRVSSLGWVSYDEQFRLRKARAPQSSWADVDVELWLLCVSAPNSPFLTEWDKNEHRDFSSDMSKRGSVLAGAITKGVVLIEKIAGSFTNAPLSKSKIVGSFLRGRYI